MRYTVDFVQKQQVGFRYFFGRIIQTNAYYDRVYVQNSDMYEW